MPRRERCNPIRVFFIDGENGQKAQIGTDLSDDVLRRDSGAFDGPAETRES